jgi:hypothetical protein
MTQVSTLNDLFDELLQHEITDEVIDDYIYIKKLIQFRIKSKLMKLNEQDLSMMNMLFAVKWFKEAHEVIGYEVIKKDNSNG